MANLDKFWSSDSQWSDALLNCEFLTAWDVCCLWRYQRGCTSHPSNVSFDFITIIILISIINDLCHNHLGPSSQQYLAIPNIFDGQTTSNANIYIKINCRRPAHFFVCSSSAVFSKPTRKHYLFWSNRAIFVFSSWHKNPSAQFRFRWFWVHLTTKRRKANPSWPKDIVLTCLWKIHACSRHAMCSSLIGLWFIISQSQRSKRRDGCKPSPKSNYASSEFRMLDFLNFIWGPALRVLDGFQI